MLRKNRLQRQKARRAAGLQLEGRPRVLLEEPLSGVDAAVDLVGVLEDDHRIGERARHGAARLKSALRAKFINLKTDSLWQIMQWAVQLPHKEY